MSDVAAAVTGIDSTAAAPSSSPPMSSDSPQVIDDPSLDKEAASETASAPAPDVDPKAKGKRKAPELIDLEEEDEDDDDDEEDDEDDDEDDEDDDDDEDDEDDDDDSENDEEMEEEQNLNDGLDASNIIEARPKRKAASKIADYTSEEAIRKAGVAPNDEGAAGGEDEDADATYMDEADEGDPTGNGDPADPSEPPLKKRRPLSTPSREPGPKPAPPRPTIRIKMFKTQGSTSASQGAVPPPPVESEDDPETYIMEIPHIMLEEMRAIDHPWATWVDETQKAAQDSVKAAEEKAEEEKQQELERRKFNAAARDAAAAAAAAASAETEAGASSGGALDPPSGPGAPALPGGGDNSDLPPHLAALLARHQEKAVVPALIPRKRGKKREAYDVNDPFVDDSEAPVEEPTQFVQPKNSGFYVCIGDVEVFRTAQQKVGRRRGGAAGAAAGAAANGTGGAKGKAAAAPAKTAAAPAAAAAAAGGVPNGAAEPKSGKVTQSALASSAKQAGAAGAMDMLLAMRAKQTGLTVSEHVAAGIQRPVAPSTGAAAVNASAGPSRSVSVSGTPVEGALPGAAGVNSSETNSRRQSEGSRMQPIPVDDSTDDESKGAVLVTGASANATGDTSNAKQRAQRDRSPVKTLAANESSSSIGLRRTPRRSASTTENKNGTAPAIAQTPEPSGSKAMAMPGGAVVAAAPDISISITGTPGGAGDTSTLIANGTPSGSNGKKNRYPCLPVHPKLAQAFQELRAVVAKEPFEVKTKFPSYLKPPLVRTAKLALELGEYNDNFFNWLPTIFPYNRFTMMKLTKREFFEAHTAYYRDLQEENLATFKKLIDKSLPVQKKEYEQALKRWQDAGGADGGKAGPNGASAAGNGDRSSPLTPAVAGTSTAAAGGGPEEQDEEEGPEAAAGKAEGGNGEEPVKRWRWDEEMRAHLHTCITAENAMVELHNEKMSLENANKTASEIARRKALYKRISMFWNEEGWVNTSAISREYTRTKTRYEKQAARAAEDAL
ncbi:hypothetical protein A4X13_0g6699 [Tilletia indica]|uniref:Ubinuclein middle domain-containing protein n=1 Tax=Tilletia indica TaxID=43049 RepID=A0A177TGY0_9BASI|nr:hypothetical protein A4X13_0g6699 [Tilletia indica]